MNKKKCVILVVEDEMPLQRAIKVKLEKNNSEVVTARTVKQALSMLKDVDEIKAIWLDHYLLGEEDGLSFVAKVKNNAKWKKIPIFVVSNTATHDKVKSYLALGINKYYTKADYRLDDIIKDIKSCAEKMTK